MSDRGRGRGRPQNSYNYDLLDRHIPLHRVDPYFNAANIGPYLGLELEANLQASRNTNALLDESFQDTISDMPPAPATAAAGSAPGPPRQEEGDPELVAQLQDLILQPSGVPDLLPPNLSQMPGLDPMFLGTGPDGLPNLPAPSEFPLPDLETQFRALLAETEIANAVEAAGLAEQVVAPKKLVVVCCLATWTGMRGTDDKWVAMPGQGTNQGWGMDMANPSEKECWRTQIWKGLEVLKEMDGEGVLMFSG